MPTKVLSDRLKSLEQHRIIDRRLYSEHPLRAEYHLTALGRSLEPVVASIYAWGIKHVIHPAERPAIRKRVAERAAARGTAVKPPS